jgi:hypothetical protein
MVQAVSEAGLLIVLPVTADLAGSHPTELD